MKAGSEEQKKLVLDHLALARKVADSYHVPGLMDEDRGQEAHIALCKAALEYDPDKGSFMKFATGVLCNHFRNLKKFSGRHPIEKTFTDIGEDNGDDFEADDYYYEDTVTVRDQFSEVDDLDEIEFLMSCLDERSRKVLKAKYAIRCEKAMTAKEIAEEFGISTPRVYQLIARARDRMKDFALRKGIDRSSFDHYFG